MDIIFIQMILGDRIECLAKLKTYMLSDEPTWQQTKHKAFYENGWFIPEFIDLAVRNIAEKFLNKESLEAWAHHYHIPSVVRNIKNVGIVMAGNIPLVGFHDLLCVLISGHKALIKPASKDEVLIKHLVEVMAMANPEIDHLVKFSEILKNCDAYIATGSNNTSRYFEYYFGKYPNIIRRSKTSIAVLSDRETRHEL